MDSLLIYSCTKIDRLHAPTDAEIEQRFFTAKANTPAPVLKVMAALQKQNAIGGFIPSLAVKDGYALWEHSTIEQPKTIPTYNRNGDGFEQNTTLVFTPIVQQDSNFVNGFFFSKIVGDSVELHLYRANDYDEYPYEAVDSTVVTAEKITLKLTELDILIYGSRKYKISNDSLFSNIKPNRIMDSSVLILKGGLDGASNKVVSSACWYVPSGVCNCTELPCDWKLPCPTLYCTAIFCVPVVGTGGTGNSPITWPPDPSPVPGGGGSNPPPGGGNCTGVNNCGILRSLIVQGKVPCGGCGSGPVVVVPPEEPPVLTQHQLDLQWMHANMVDTTNDPCILNALNTLKILDTTVPGLIRNFFDTMPSFKMVIGTENYSTWIFDAVENAYSPPHGAQTIYNLHSDTFSVLINKYYNKSTDLALASAILHEALHCQLMYWVRHAAILGDTVLRNNLARKYGYVFEKTLAKSDTNLIYIIANAPVSVTHHTMAIKFKNEMVSALKDFALKKGIIVNNEYIEKLAWAGCTDSKAFKDLSLYTQEEIKKAINSEKDPTSQKLNPNGDPLNLNFITPKGYPCP